MQEHKALKGQKSTTSQELQFYENVLLRGMEPF